MLLLLFNLLLKLNKLNNKIKLIILILCPEGQLIEHKKYQKKLHRNHQLKEPKNHQ